MDKDLEKVLHKYAWTTDCEECHFAEQCTAEDEAVLEEEEFGRHHCRDFLMRRFSGPCELCEEQHEIWKEENLKWKVASSELIRDIDEVDNEGWLKSIIDSYGKEKAFLELRRDIAMTGDTKVITLWFHQRIVAQAVTVRDELNYTVCHRVIFKK